jgi:hypothetical protein
MAYLTAVENLGPAVVHWPAEARMICEHVDGSAIFNRRQSGFRLPQA